ncbi:MAG: hypothetical protein ACQEWM_12665 [Actinomycetota bacterium]
MRRRDTIGLSLLVPGVLPLYAAFLALGNRIFPTADVARSNEMPHAAVYFLGPEANSPFELAAVLAWIAIGIVGVALIAAGYRLISTEVAGGPPLRPVDAPRVWHWLDV